MRYLKLMLLFLLVANVIKGQTIVPPSGTGTPNSINWFRGMIMADSGIVIKNMDTASARTKTQIPTIVKHTDNNIYYWNGTGYLKVLVEGGVAGFVPSTRTLTINGTAYDLSADRSWTISTGGGGASILNDLLDVDIVSPVTGQLFRYNGTNWTNFTPNYLTTEVDGSTTNEIQTLSRSGTNLNLSLGGGSVVDSNHKYAAGSNMSVSGTYPNFTLNAIVPDVSNFISYEDTPTVIPSRYTLDTAKANVRGELQSHISLDNDLSPTNEIQTMSFNSSTRDLTISSGNTVNIPDANTTYEGSVSVPLVGTSFQRAALTGDVTASANSNATTIANNAVTNAKAADMAANTIKGRAAATGDPQDLTPTQVRTIINVEDGANNYVHPNSGVLAGTYNNVTVNLQGHVTAASNESYIPATRTVTAGDGLTGGGDLSANRTITLGTPSTINLGSTNSVTATSHTHAFDLGGTADQYLRGNNTLAPFPTIPTVNNGILNMGTSGIATGSASFTANQASNSTFTVNVPSTLSSYTNDIGFLRAVDTASLSDRINLKQDQLNGTGFVKASGTTISYDNSTYVPTSRTLTINGNALDLSADRAWSVSLQSAMSVANNTNIPVAKLSPYGTDQGIHLIGAVQRQLFGYTGAIAIKHAPVSNTAIGARISITSYLIGRIIYDVYFLRQTSATALYSPYAIITQSTSTLPSTLVRVAHDGSGNVTILLGDVTTNWGSSVMDINVEMISTNWTGGDAASWRTDAWTIVNETDLSGYSTLYTATTKVVADRDWVQAQGYLTGPSTLQQVTTAGNTTTNNITINRTSSANIPLEIIRTPVDLSPLQRWHRNTSEGYLDILSGTSAFFAPTIASFNSTSNQNGLQIRGYGKTDFGTASAINLRAGNADYTGGVTAGSVLKLQNYTTDLLNVDYQGVTTLSNLSGTGNRMVVANATGTLSTQPITTGTVTSVGMTTAGTALDVAPSAITSSGTFALTWAGTAAQYVNGLGNLVAFPTIPAGTVTSVAIGNGLIGTSPITSTGTITLGTPSDITAASTNSVTATSHTHALAANSVVTAKIADGAVTNAKITSVDWTKITGAPATASNLSLGTATATTQPINNDNGTGVTLPSATTTQAGLMSAGDKIKLSSDELVKVNANYVIPNNVGTVIFYNVGAINVTLPDPAYDRRKIYLNITQDAGSVALIGTYPIYDYTTGVETDVSGNFNDLFRHGGGMIQSDGTKWYVILSTQ